ncbi:hypothetical protein [Flagellimonas meridianipacifica]|uniref:Uncharacterized protein n=1 Tax=Flagellimonas meridianipacifica TaxID=1080225 RepID=A0A2T0MJ43_9FLAO|nr:hypothetical protein [Allomuricauda pacifica]PRX57604.1 hypothetical protein CLV81_1612 [Allomuricauda pacifica]
MGAIHKNKIAGWLWKILLKGMLRWMFVILMFGTSQMEAQEVKKERNPIPMEILFGHEKINYLAIMNFTFGKSKFGYFGVSSVLVPYENERANNEFVLSNVLTYNFSGKFYATRGAQFHYSKGVVPTAGIQFFSASPTWLFLLNPNLQFAPDTNVEAVGIVEYKPRLSENLGLYTRFQGIYNQNLESGLHDRSLLYLRLGLTKKKTSFGFGFNLDFYGQDRRREENFGIFINHLF